MTLSSGGWDSVTSLLPFVFLFGFWLYLMRKTRAGGDSYASRQEALIEKLDEVLEELRRLRKAIEDRSSGF